MKNIAQELFNAPRSKNLILRKLIFDKFDIKLNFHSAIYNSVEWPVWKLTNPCGLSIVNRAKEQLNH